jgi:uncharacterized protein with PQ loop repeat
MKKGLVALLAVLLTGMVSAQQVVSGRSGLSPLFYISIIVLALGILFIVFAMRRLGYSGMQIWKSAWISFMIALVISLVLFFISSSLTVVHCEVTLDGFDHACPTGFDLNLPLLLPGILVVFFFTLVIYYIIVFFKHRRSVV